MTEKNKLESVSKEMMDELDRAKDEAPSRFFVLLDKNKFEKIKDWLWKGSSILPTSELTKRESKLMKHIYFNDPQFELKKPKKYVVRFKKADIEGEFLYLTFKTVCGFEYSVNTYVDDAFKFNTQEEAEKWTNPLTEVIEVEEDE